MFSNSLHFLLSCSFQKTSTATNIVTRMWANAQRDSRPAEYRRRPVLNAAKFGVRPLLECRAVMMLIGQHKTWRFVRSFVLCGQEPSLLWTPARKPSIGPVRMPMERGRELVGVCGVCTMCGRGRLSRHVRSLSGIYYSVKAWLTVWLAWLALCSNNPPALVQHWPRWTLEQRCQRPVTSINLGHAGASRHSWR